MTDLSLLPRPRPRVPDPHGKSPETIALETLIMLVVATLVVVALALGEKVFVPIAMAVLLSFVLAPGVRRLRLWGVNRAASVSIVALLAFLAIASLGAIMGRQMTDLAADFPRYQTTITSKVDALRGRVGQSSLFEGLSRALDNFGGSAAARRPPGSDQGANGAAAAQTDAGASQLQGPRPVPVEVQQPSTGPYDVLKVVLSRVLEPLTTTGVVLVFVIFILLQREDLYDRLIRLVGSSDLRRTTAAVEDAARRLSRYFVAQTAINTAFGVIVAVGLSIIGVPSPILWGIFATIMRFIPYIGAVMAAAGPLALAVAVDPGWSMVAETFAFFVITESIMGQGVEPLLYGRSTGLSPIAVVISATFWTWLWGPVGLVLATPLTVCLVVLGRHVERLEFIDVLLGDAPALTPVESFYQRLLAGHPAQAVEQAEEALEHLPLSAYYDDTVLHALAMAQDDLRVGRLDARVQEKVRDTLVAVVESLSDYEDVAPAGKKAKSDAAADAIAADEGETSSARQTPPSVAPDELSPDWRGPAPVLLIAGQSILDEAGCVMLGQLLGKHGLIAQVEPPDALGGMRVAPHGVALACLFYLDDGLTPALLRFATRRLRRRLPNATLLVTFGAEHAAHAHLRRLCAEAGADVGAMSLGQAVEICVLRARGDKTESDAAAGNAENAA